MLMLLFYFIMEVLNVFYKWNQAIGIAFKNYIHISIYPIPPPNQVWADDQSSEQAKISLKVLVMRIMIFVLMRENIKVTLTQKMGAMAGRWGRHITQDANCFFTGKHLSWK